MTTARGLHLDRTGPVSGRERATLRGPTAQTELASVPDRPCAQKKTGSPRPDRRVPCQPAPARKPSIQAARRNPHSTGRRGLRRLLLGSQTSEAVRYPF